MDVSITEAAKLSGVSRTTLYTDMNSGTLSYKAKGKNKRVVNVAELERVYGKLKVGTSNEVSEDVKPEQKVSSVNENSQQTLVELAVLREKLDTLEKERSREREQFQNHIEQIQESLVKAQDNQAKTTLLLKDYTQDKSSDKIDGLLRTLEARIDKQEQATKEQISEAEKTMHEEKQRTEKALTEKKDYQNTTVVLYIVTGFLALILAAVLFLYTQGMIDIIPAS